MMFKDPSTRGRYTLAMTSQTLTPVEVLMVEDNEGDRRLTEEALKDSKLKIRLNMVVDGVEALSYLRREGKYASARKPDLILLDLNLPRMSGTEVLEQIKKEDQLKDIPVVIMTSSKAEKDVVESYRLHANCYIVKPIDLEQFGEVVRSVDHFWFSVVTLPPKN